MKKIGKHERSAVYRAVSGIITVFAIILCVLLIMAGFTAKGTLPESAMGTIVYSACFIGGLVGTLIAVKGYQGKRFIFTAGLCCIMLILMLLTGWALSGKQGFSGMFIANAAALVVGTLIVGIAGKRRAFKRR